MKHILVATDFSARSDRALRRAMLIARKVDAALTLAHVVDSDRPQGLVAAERTAATAMLAEAAHTLQTEDGITAYPLVTVDDVHSGILSAADEIDADLIVIGPHRAQFRDVFIGTTAERVVRRTRRPLMVAAEPPGAQHRRTLLALDFSAASESAARAALAMGVFDHTDVVVMHAFDAPAEGMMRRSLETTGAIDDYVRSVRTDATERLHAMLSEIGLPPTGQRVVAINGTPARTILETARSEGAELIVLGTNQRKGFERLLIGSVTENVIREAGRDVLIVPVDEAEPPETGDQA